MPDRPSLRHRLPGAPLVLALLCLTRCGGSNALSGSVSAIFPLDFNSVACWRDDEAFQVSYYYAQLDQEDLVIQLTVELSGIDFTPGAAVDLSGTVTTGEPRATVVHIEHGEAPLVLPAIASGTLNLSSGGGEGQATSGNFSLAFADDGTLGPLHTLTGNFDGPCSTAEFPPDASYGFVDAGPDAGL